MPGNFLRIISLVMACVAAIVSSASAADRPAVQELREETWALMTPLPIFAYVVRPVGGGPYPLLIMNMAFLATHSSVASSRLSSSETRHIGLRAAVISLSPW